MAHNYKGSVIPFGGYLYQNLVGLELLVNWLDDANLFNWVRFEADIDEVPKGLDDVVASRSDGTLVMLQVKFTVDPFNEQNFLSWNWLLQKKPKGKSLLQKWFAVLQTIGNWGKVEAALITNRLPDRDISASINPVTRRVDLTTISTTISRQLEEQLGGREKVEEFFLAFEFRHSHQGYLALERTLKDRLIPRHTNNHGWLCLFREAIDWATRKSFPPPDGRIELSQIRGVISSSRPSPLPQSFRVPDGYVPPDESFKSDFLDRISTGSRKLTVLWGSPGQGKSTFLSYICGELDAKKTPYIRHHYFLEFSDNSDRFSFSRVANSLMSQIEAGHSQFVHGLKDDPENLRDWIEACAAGYAAQGKRFVVVVDGLDHVWRENERNTRPLDSLFQSLLPVVENVALVLGTQKVAPLQLPSKFSRFVDEKDWTELPRMSLKAIRRWLLSQLDTKRFELPKSGIDSDDSLTGIVSAFEQLSGGHPLILTYSFEALAREKRILTKAGIEEFPVRPQGDVKKYYEGLWHQLSVHARNALHLIADSGFTWPTLGLETCLRIEPGALSKEIGHLFHLTDVGPVPFHGSLLVHIQESHEHRASVQRLIPSVVEWLSNSAPDFHRWGWLWLYKARIGDPSELVNRPDRKWAIESLARAYPRDQLHEILSEAERIAFEGGDFPRAVRLRWLKIRILNGTDLQLDDYGRVYRCALRLSPDEYPRKLLGANEQSANVARLSLLADQYIDDGRLADAIQVQEHIKRRINDRLAARIYRDADLQEDLQTLFGLMASTGSYDPKHLVRSIQKFGSISLEVFRTFLARLAKKADLRSLLEIASCPMRRDLREELELRAIRLAGSCHARVHEWQEFKRFRRHPLGSCWALLHSPANYRGISFQFEVKAVDVKDGSDSKDKAAHFLHKLFFARLASCLEANGAPLPSQKFQFENRKWLSVAVDELQEMANVIGGALARGNIIGFSIPYRLVDTLIPPASYAAFGEYVAFRIALLTLASDLFLLTALRSGLSQIPNVEWEQASSSRHFLFSEWQHQYLRFGAEIVANDCIEKSIRKELAESAAYISPFNDRTEKYLELCELAVSQGLRSTAQAALERVLSCAIGYGWRKDGTLAHVISAIEAIAPTDATFGRDAVRRIAGIVSNIAEMTEDDAARESDLAELLLLLSPDVFARYYAYWIGRAAWYSAEQIFAEFLKVAPLSEAHTRIATAAVSDPHAVSVLRDRSKGGDPSATATLAENSLRFGRPSGALGQKREYSTPIDETYKTNVKDFGPSDLSGLLAALDSEKAFVGSSKAVREWFEFWKGRGRDSEILKSIEGHLSQRRVAWGVCDLLDDTFEISVRLEGKARAYRLLLAAQIHGHGWDGHYPKEAAIRRFRVFENSYRDKWKTFIYESSRSAYENSNETLQIPHHRLVQFLVIVGQLPLARDVAEQMIASVVEDFEDQPINVPDWVRALE